MFSGLLLFKGKQFFHILFLQIFKSTQSKLMYFSSVFVTLFICILWTSPKTGLSYFFFKSERNSLKLACYRLFYYQYRYFHTPHTLLSDQANLCCNHTADIYTYFYKYIDIINNNNSTFEFSLPLGLRTVDTS